MDINLNDVVEVKLISSQGLQLSFNIIHYRISAETVVTGRLQDLEAAQSFAAFNNSLVAPCMSNGAQTEGATAQVIRPTPHPFAFAIGQAAGTVGGDALPKQVAGVITKLTAGIGRANRGRFYVPFPPETESSAAGAPDAAWLASAATLASGLFSAPFVISGVKGSSTFVPVIYHRATGTTTDITGTAIRTKWGTQRRRGDFGAINQLPWVNLI